jgi:Carboxypeptidase regulatory-like domain
VFPTSRARWIAIALALVLAACQPSATAASPSPTATPLRSLAVVVSGPAGASIAGATVCAFTVADRQEGCGETSASGTARLEVHPGTYALRVAPKQGTRLEAQRTWATVVDGDATVVVALEPHSTISGTVRDDAGNLVTGAQVCAHPPSAASPTCANSGAQGSYTIDVRSDVYKLQVTGPPSGKLVPQWARGRISSDEADVIDVRSADAAGVDVALIRGALLTGIVRGPSGPIEDAQVCLRTLAAPLGWECERTKKNGSYLALREPGRYFLWVVPPDNVRLVAQWYNHVLEGVDASVVDLTGDRSIDVALDSGPQIRGKVTTTDGAPVGSAFVCVDTPFPTSRICRPTGADGTYAVTTRPETYVMQILPPTGSDLISEFWSRKRAWNDADWVTLGSADRVLDLTLRKGVRITGVIRDSRGVPLEAATININDDAGPLIGADTDASGTYSVVVAPGHYSIEAFAPFRGDLTSLAPQDITVNGFTRMDFVLQDANP